MGWRIAILNLHRGGMMHYAAAVAGALRTADPGVETLLLRCVDDAAPLLPDDGHVRRFRVPQERNLTGVARLLVSGPGLCGAVRGAVQAFRPDVLHLTSGHLLYGALLPRLSRTVPLVSTFHDIHAHPGESRIYKRLKQAILLRYSRVVFVHGAALHAYACRRWAARAERFVPIPFVMPRWDAPGPAAEEEADRVLLLGRVYAYKGIELLLEALPRIAAARPGVRLTIAGEGNLGPWRGALEQQRARIDIVNRYLDDAEMAALVRQCALVVLPYHEASQSGVAFTAAALGRAVVATDVGSLCEQVLDGKTGRLVPPGNAAALADAVVELLADPVRRRRMGEAARRHHGVDLHRRVGRALLQAYARCTGRPWPDPTPTVTRAESPGPALPP